MAVEDKAPEIFAAIWAELLNAPLKIPVKLFAIIVPLELMFPEAVVFPLMYAPPPYKIPLALILPDAVMFVEAKVSVSKVYACIVPLALIPPDAVMFVVWKDVKDVNDPVSPITVWLASITDDVT